MDNFDQQFKKDGKQVALLKAEKDQMLNRILAMPIDEPKKQSSLSFFRIFFNVKFAVTAVLVLLVAGTTSVTYAAQKSGPGDLLHSFELNVIEPIEEAIYFGQEQKIAYATSRLEERLDEIQNAPEENITEEESTTIVQNVQEQVDAVLRALPQQTDEKEKLNHLVTVSALLRAHEDVLTETEQPQLSIEDLNEDVADQLSEQVEDYTEDQTPADLAQDVQEEIAASNDIIEEISNNPEAKDIQAQLKDAETETQKGNVEEAFEDVINAKVQALTINYIEEDPNEETGNQ